jgi:predicted MFS family arabinose efflux permease
VNALYMTATFIGGATGSLLGTITYNWADWRATAGTGMAIGFILLGLLALEMRGRAHRR